LIEAKDIGDKNPDGAKKTAALTLPFISHIINIL